MKRLPRVTDSSNVEWIREMFFKCENSVVKVLKDDDGHWKATRVLNGDYRKVYPFIGF